MYELNTLSFNELVTFLENDDSYLSVFLSEPEQFLSIQNLLANQYAYFLIPISEEQLKSQLTILQAVYQSLFNVSPPCDLDGISLIEHIENKSGIFNRCVLTVRDFSQSHTFNAVESLGFLLELVIVSKAFNLLYETNTVDEFDFLSNARLWRIVTERSVRIKNSTSSLLFEKSNELSNSQIKILDNEDLALTHLERVDIKSTKLEAMHHEKNTEFNLQKNINSDNNEILEVTNNFSKPANNTASEAKANRDGTPDRPNNVFDPLATQPLTAMGEESKVCGGEKSDSIVTDNINIPFENDTFSNKTVKETEKIKYQTKFSKERDQSSQDKSQQGIKDQNVNAQKLKKRALKDQPLKIVPWYQLVPKYHLAIFIITGLFLLVLWQIDLSQTKQRSLQLSLPLDLVGIDDVDEKSDLLVKKLRNSQSQAKTEKGVIKTLSQPALIAKDNSEITSSTSPTTPVTDMLISSDNVKNENNSSTIDPEEPKIQAQPENLVVNKKIDWSPYQSNKWIELQNPKYFTLQLIASHKHEGIKIFLSSHGVNNQYAVYNTTKNNEPWHIVIYGVYESRQLASEARAALPDYLTQYSPWIRSFEAVQNALK